VKIKPITCYLLLILFLTIVSIPRAQAKPNQKPIRLGITTVLVDHAINANESLAAYLEHKVGVRVEIVQKPSFQAINDMMERHEIDIAFVCGSSYTIGHDRFGMRLLVAPQVYPEGPIYYSYLIVPNDSTATSLIDLKSQRYAFSDPLSMSGTLIVMRDLVRLGERPESFFKRTIFTHSHSANVEAVADKLVDGASVMSYVWDYLAATDPTLVAKIRIIAKSEPLSMSPVVVGAHVDPKLAGKLRTALLKIHEDPVGMSVLAKLRFLKFVQVQDNFYDPIRNVQELVNNAMYQYSLAQRNR
jgi:phosphonate transport system substrate-binding protein